ncbi:MAG: hypothetical protein JOZ51_27725 [Chloroflexi bacterium]|nr:hypothetical protein [Chloroflexota bacterium]
MKRFDQPAHAEGADSGSSYFSHGLLAKVLPSDQSLARPTEHVRRRRWINRMILAEIGFVLGVALLQFFPVIDDSSAATTTTQPTATVAAPTATAEPSPEATQTSDVITATIVAELPQPSLTALPAAVIPVALPDTGGDGAIAAPLYAAPLLCIGGGLALWLLAGSRSAGDVHGASAAGRADDEGIGL